MNSEQFFKAVDGIDDKLLEGVFEDVQNAEGYGAEPQRATVYRIERRRFSPKTLAGAAACVAAAVGIGFAVKAGINKLPTQPDSTFVGSYIDAAGSGSSGEQADAQKSAGQSSYGNFEGVVMIVTTDKTEYNLGDTINVKATVKNTTDKTIGLFVGTSTPNSHMEIETQISLNDKYLIDPDKPYSFNALVTTVLIEPGKEYVQEMRFETNYYSRGLEKNLAEPGVYAGASRIRILRDPENEDVATLGHVMGLVEFTVKLTDDPTKDSVEPSRDNCYPDDYIPIIVKGDDLSKFEYNGWTYYRIPEDWKAPGGDFSDYDFTQIGRKAAIMTFVGSSRPDTGVYELSENAGILVAVIDGEYIPYVGIVAHYGNPDQTYPE